MNERRIDKNQITSHTRERYGQYHISGNVFPMKEIEIKSQISGVLDKINVSIGDKVRIGD